MHPGIVGGIIGGLSGLVGGCVGTYFSIKNTQGPRERAFMIKSAVLGWGLILLLGGVMVIVPGPYRWFVGPSFAMILPFAILYGNKKQQAIRLLDSKEQEKLL